MLHLARRERRRRLIQDNHGGVLGERLCDLDHLLPRHRQIGDDVVGRDIDFKLRQHLACSIAHLPPVHPVKSAWPPSEKDVLRGRHVWHQREFLEHRGDPERTRRERIRQMDRPAVVQNGSGIGLMGPAQSLDQRGLTAAVLPDEPVNLAAA